MRPSSACPALPLRLGAARLPHDGPPAQVVFIGFGRRGASRASLQLLLIAAGDPDAVARWLALAWRSAADPRDLARQALASIVVAWRPLTDAAQEEVRYRYRLVLGRRGGITLSCWRCHGPPIGWLRRCGPMPLERFLDHRLAGSGLWSPQEDRRPGPAERT